MTKLTFKVRGLDCAEEVALLKRELVPLFGGDERLAFDILNAKLIVDMNASEHTSQDIIQAVARTGMRADPFLGEQIATDLDRRQQQRRLTLTIVSGMCGLAGFFVHWFSAGSLRIALGSEGFSPWSSSANTPLLSVLLYASAIVAGTWLVLPKAWRAASGFRPDMNLLMTIAVVGAAAIGEWLEGATVAFLFAVSLWLESWSVGRARHAIGALLDLAPPMARVRNAQGVEVLMRAEMVPVHSTFVVRPGERIPLDGRVVLGSSYVNQAPITGESLPQAKSAGSDVFAGTINGEGVIEITSTKPASETTLAHIVRMVGEAQSRRAPLEHWVDRFARVYTPTVLALAAAILLVPAVVVDAIWSEWIYRSLILLVIACPCALVISTPVSVVAALAASARNGVLIKGGEFIEAPAQLQAIAIDKTGTLTLGQPTVVDVVPLSGHNEVELLERAAGLEMYSNHPLARAIVSAAQQRNITIPAASKVASLPGKGASGEINGQIYWVGSHRYLLERQQSTSEIDARLDAMQQAGRTVVVVGNNRHVCGFVTLADSLRPLAAETIEQLRAAGIKQLVMLTGDHRGTANVIARESGIDEVHAELLPQDKVAVIETLVTKYGSVAMVGDGVNDAPAMARATLGIAMGAAGSDAAIETADIALMSDDLAKLPWLINHSRRTVAVIRQNIFFALSVKALFVLLAFAGFASLWAAIAADMGASFLVIANGLRLLKYSSATANDRRGLNTEKP